MIKRLAWAVIIIAFIIYCIVVWGWWQEGNRNFSGPAVGSTKIYK